MPLPLSLPNRLRAATPGARLRRVLGWAAVAVLFVAAALGVGAFAVVGVAPSLPTRAMLDAAALVAAVLLYALVGPGPAGASGGGALDPVALLWTRLLLALGLVGALALAAFAVENESADFFTHLPSNLSTATAAGLLAALHGVVAAALLRGLRPLVLARPTPAGVRTWRAFLAFALLVGLARMTAEPGAPPSVVHLALVVLAVGAMAACAFRQGWVVPLPLRRRLAAVGLAAALAAALTVALVMEAEGPGAVPVEGQAAAERVPYLYLFSAPLADVVALALAFGVLYGLTAVLTLLFSMPASGAYAQRAGEVRAFRALTELSAEGLDRVRLAEAIARAPVEAGIAGAAWLALADPQRGTLAAEVVAAQGLSLEAAAHATDAAALTADALGRQAPLVLGTAAADHRVHARPGDGVGSLLVLPLRASGQAHGALFAARATPDGFPPEDQTALAAFAGQAALALSHAALFERAIKQERLERELALAREVQERLLPQRLPEVGGVELAAVARPAQEVGGDYYDVVEIGDGCLGLIVADVAGKGAAAAFYMAELKGIFQSASRLTRSPGEFLARANEAIGPSLGKSSFISAVYGVVDTHRGTLTLARAGHCPVAMARKNGGLWLLRAAGLGLGLDPGPLFRRTLHEQTVHLEPGDAFALYTDGLVEARDPSGEEYGYARLAEALHRHRAHRADVLLDALLDDQRRFAGRGPLADDLTLLVVKWRGTGEPASDDPDSSHNGQAAPALDALPPPVTVRPAFA